MLEFFDFHKHFERVALGTAPYILGKPVEQLLREKGLSHAVKLASNQNIYGSSPKTMMVIAPSLNSLWQSIMGLKQGKC